MCLHNINIIRSPIASVVLVGSIKKLISDDCNFWWMQSWTNETDWDLYKYTLITVGMIQAVSYWLYMTCQYIPMVCTDNKTIHQTVVKISSNIGNCSGILDWSMDQQNIVQWRNDLINFTPANIIKKSYIIKNHQTDFEIYCPKT